MKRLTILFVALLASAGASAKDVTYTHGGDEYEGYYVSAGETAPLVILLHDWDGLTDYEKTRARMLHDEGYSVFAADLFGKGVRPTKVEDKRQHTGELYQDRAKMRSVLQAGLNAAKERGGRTEHAVVMGYCFGGAAALEWARAGADLRGFISVHGGLSTPEKQDYSKARGQILVQHGAADQSVTMDDFAQLTVQMQQADLEFMMEVYGGAEHAWTVFGGERYHKDADAKSWQSQLRFLKQATQ